MLENYWIVWPVGIALWVLLGWIEFGYFEREAFVDPSDKHITLSYFVYYVSTKFPLSIFWAGLMIGLFFGTLSTHFLWHWCPPGSVSTG